MSGISYSTTILWSVSIGWISNYTFTIFRMLGSHLEKFSFATVESIVGKIALT